MTRFFMAFFLAVLTGLASAQTAPIDSVPRDIDAERAKNSAERARLEIGFQTEDAACHEKFAVNSCLEKVNSRRRAVMADLRRDEILLNDEERKISGARQIRKSEDKAAPEKRQEATDRRANAAEDYQSRLSREKTKQLQRASVSSGEKTAREASAKRLTDHQKKTRARTDRQAAAAEEVKKFGDRQKQAQARRAQYEIDKLGRSKPPAKSLPLPE